MMVNHVYKTKTTVVFERHDDRTRFEDLIDLKIYEKFEKFTFKQNIDHLLEQEIIGKNTHRLLDNIRLRRNYKIHDLNAHFTDEDREWFDVEAIQ
jgi:hypothetical protein